MYAENKQWMILAIDFGDSVLLKLLFMTPELCILS